MNKNQIIKVIGFCFAFILFSFVGSEVWATQLFTANGDTLVDLAIEYTTGYPGHFVEVSVLIANLVAISSFKLEITLGGWDLIDYHTDSVGVEWVAVPLDTCPGTDTCLVDTCWWEPDNICMDTVYFPVRYCYIDTVGSLISNFEMISCHGAVGDTNLPDCKSITVVGIAYLDSFIPPDPNYRLLFKFGVDLFCMCDVDTGRSVFFVISPGFSFFGDPGGSTVPFSYWPLGEVFAWWSEPGDANNDSSANLADAIYIVNWLFMSGPSPCIWEAADANASCEVNLGDAAYLVNWLYLGGPLPQRGCSCPYPQKGRKIDEGFELLEDLNLKPLLERR